MRIIRFLLWFIAVIALVVMSYVVALYFLVNAESVSNRLSSELDRNFGYKITMHAAPQVRVLPTIEIDLPAATVSDKNGKTVFFYRSAYLEVNPIWLVLGQTHIEKLHFDGVSTQIIAPQTWPEFIESLKTNKLALFNDIVIKNISINQGELTVKAQDKTLSLRNIALSVDEPAPQMHGAVNVAAQLADSSRGLLFDATTSLMLDLDLNQGIIGIEDLQLQAQGTRGATPLSIAMNTNLARLEAQNAYISSAQAQLLTNDNNDQVAVSVADLQLDSTQWQAPDFHIYFAQGSGQQRMELDLRSPVAALWTDKTWNAAHIQGSILLPATNQASPISGQTYVDWTKQKVDFELFARLHDAPMSFKGHLESFDHPKIKGQLTFGRLDLLELQKLSILQGIHFGHTFNEQEIITETDPVNVSDVDVSDKNETQEPAIDGQVSENPADTSTESQPAEVNNSTPSSETPIEQPSLSPVVWIDTNEGRFMHTQASTEASSNQSSADSQVAFETVEQKEPFDWSILNTFDFQGDIIIGELIYCNSRLLQVKGPMTVSSGTLKMPKLTGLAYESHFNAFASVNAQGHWNMQFKASNANLGALLSDIGTSVSMPGKFDTQINLYGDDFSLSALNGQVGFVVQQSALYGVNLNDALLTIEKGQIPTQTMQAKSNISKLRGVATLHAAEANIENLTVGFNGFTLKGQATVNLKDQSIKGLIVGNSHRGLAVEANLAGSWFQPQLYVDANRIMKANNITPKPVTSDRAKDKKSGWDRLKSFIKDRL